MDPNPENFVGAGIIQTKALQVGCLLRLEPNAQAQVSAEGSGPPCDPIPYALPSFLFLIIFSPVFLYLPYPSDFVPLGGLSPSTQMYRLTLRTSKEPVSRHLCELLAQQF